MAHLALAAALLCLLAVAADFSPDSELGLVAAAGSPAQHGDRVAREAQPANRNAQKKKDKRISDRQRLRQRNDKSKIKVLQKQNDKRVKKSEKKEKGQKEKNKNKQQSGKKQEKNRKKFNRVKQGKNTKKVRKSKLTNRKKKKQQAERERKTGKDATCRGPRVVTDECLTSAMESLKYEKNQVTNYLKQSKRLDNHQNISANKLNKQDEFQSAAKHMLWAIGGNIRYDR